MILKPNAQFTFEELDNPYVKFTSSAKLAKIPLGLRTIKDTNRIKIIFRL